MKDYNDAYETMERVTTMLGTIIDEWQKGGSAPTMSEMEEIYGDTTDVMEFLMSKL